MPGDVEAGPDALSQSDAADLAHVLAVHALAAASARALIFKGPVASAQGLRAARHSCDVDVLCDPAAFDRACAHLLSLGWTANAADSQAIGMHATTFFIPGWPCTVDVHNRFPGLLAPRQEVFDALWAAASPIELAHQSVLAPGRADHFILLALNTLRHLPPDAERSGVPAASNAWDQLDDSERQTVSSRARALGALEPLRLTLTGLGVEPGPRDERHAAALHRWNSFRAAPEDSGMIWLNRWRATAWPDRPRLILHAAFDLSLEVNESADEWADIPTGRRWLARARRVLRGAGHLADAARRSRRTEVRP